MDDREACFRRFTDAVESYLRGDRAPGVRLIESVRERFGDEAADRQRRELNNYILAQRKKRASNRN